MDTTDNTILITGGGSGIGRGLAEAFHSLGNKVIIAGRRPKPLEEVTRANPGIVSATLDVADPSAIRGFAAEIIGRHPDLNVLINNAGISGAEDLLSAPANLEKSEAIVTTNLLGPIRLTCALLPHLLKRNRPAIFNVSSGLAFVPLPAMATYCATKAAIHSYTQSLRWQLRDTLVQVFEIIPPYVQTELGGPTQAVDPRAMPLKDFITETMRIIQSDPREREICVERVKALRFAEANGAYNSVFQARASEPLRQMTL
ncbi:MAG: SDR family oxidoreductase [Chthoniobacteraceae bacterium]